MFNRSTLKHKKFKLRRFLFGISSLLIIILLQSINNYWLRTAGVILIMVGFIVVINRLSHDRRRLLQLVTLDELTGLGNFKAFQDRIRCETQRSIRRRNPLALILVDLDKFKNYNDTYGHRAGNELLHSAGQVFQKAVRTMDGVYRFGGDEFAFVLPETKEDEAYYVAKRIRLLFEALPNRGTVTLSMGMAIYKDESLDNFFDRVDHLLYAVKAKGGNCCNFEYCESYPHKDTFRSYMKG